MLRVAVLGAGHWGPNLIANFADNQRSEVSWVVDRDAERLDVVRRRFPGVKTSSDAAAVLREPDVDAAVIATPTCTHFELARLALEAGKHTLVEKPLTDRSATSAELCELAERRGVRLMVGHVFVYNDAARWVKRSLDRGELGRVYYLSMVRTNLGPIRVDVDAAWDLAAHDIALASHWLGARPVAVAARGGSWINPGIADAVFATLRYPDDVLVNLQASWLNPRKAREIVVVGDKQMLTFDDMNLEQPLRIYDKRVVEERRQIEFVDSFDSFRMSVVEGDVTIPQVPKTQPLRNECEHFLDCVLENEESLSDGASGLDVVRTLEALSRSLEAGGGEVLVTR